MKDGVCITFANVSKLTTDGCGVTLPCDFWKVLILPNSFVENYLHIAQEKLIHLDAHFRWECNPLNNEWSIKPFSSQLHVLHNHVRILRAVHSIKTIAWLSWIFQSSYTTESSTFQHIKQVMKSTIIRFLKYMHQNLYLKNISFMLFSILRREGGRGKIILKIISIYA